MPVKKYLLCTVLFFVCVTVSSCQILQCLISDVHINEPLDGSVTTAKEISVSGCGSNEEIQEVALYIDHSFYDVKEIERNSFNIVEYFSFDFFSVTIRSGNVNIEVRGYSNWPIDEIASYSVSILCDRTPPTIVITSPENNAIINSDSVTFTGFVSDNDRVLSFRYYGEYGDRANIPIDNGEWSVTVENLPYEYQYITFIAEDRVRNLKSERIYFTCIE